MRWNWVIVLLAVAAASPSLAHGPQIQTTLDNGKVVTRRLIKDGPYSTSLTPQTSVYVMPLNHFANVWQSHPNNHLLPNGNPEFPSGPGLAYGYGYNAPTNPAPFPVGSQFELGFAGGLRSWNGAAFVDAGATEIEAYRGSGPNLVIARTSDLPTFQSIKFPPAPAGIVFSGGTPQEAHTSVSCRMLGDGTSTASALPDGVYLVSLQLDNTSASVAVSDTFYFLLTKNPSPGSTQAAVAALGFDASRVQAVPEPSSAALGVCGLIGLLRARRRRAG